MKLFAAFFCLALLGPLDGRGALQTGSPGIEQWALFEVTLRGPESGNPFLEVRLSAEFRRQHRTVQVEGFYDGDGNYRVRFMPDSTGEWTWRTRSNRPELDGRTGRFTCSPARPGNHGPVAVRRTFHFGYADGAPYFPVGTTAYAWIHQGDQLELQTLATLRNSPFNKLRMCVFPKDYVYNRNEPQYYPFPRDAKGNNDYSRIHPIPNQKYPGACQEGSYYLFYYDLHQPAEMDFDLPKGVTFRADLIDPWNMTVTPLPGTCEGKFVLKLPWKPFQALRFRKTRG